MKNKSELKRLRSLNFFLIEDNLSNKKTPYSIFFCQSIIQITFGLFLFSTWVSFKDAGKTKDGREHPPFKRRIGF